MMDLKRGWTASAIRRTANAAGFTLALALIVSDGVG
jgi:hypothetical protein